MRGLRPWRDVSSHAGGLRSGLETIGGEPCFAEHIAFDIGGNGLPFAVWRLGLASVIEVVGPQTLESHMRAPGVVPAELCDLNIGDLPMAHGKDAVWVPAGDADVTGVYYSPDGTLLVSRCRGGKIRAWSCAEHRLLREWDDPNSLYFLRFRADGGRLVSLNIKGEAIWRDTRTWQAVRTFTVGTESLLGTHPWLGRTVSPDGHLLALGTETGAVRWLSGETGELLATTGTAHRHPVVGIAFSGDGVRAASVAEDGTVAIWDPSLFQLIAAFRGHVQGAHGVVFSPDGRRLATGGGVSREAVKLWDLSTQTPRELMTLSGQGSVFLFVAFCPDGRWLAARSMEGKLHLWRAPSWAEIEAAEKQEGSHEPER